MVEALEEALRPEGTLAGPTHSGDWSYPAGWVNLPVPESWWPLIQEGMPAYDPFLTPTRGMGSIPDCLLRQPGTRRSSHPQTSFAARDPRAVEVVGSHQLSDPLGEGAPLARIYDLGGWVLLLGVGHDSNTSLHLAEYRADWPSKRRLSRGAPIHVAGERRWVAFEDLDIDDATLPRSARPCRRRVKWSARDRSAPPGGR